MIIDWLYNLMKCILIGRRTYRTFHLRIPGVTEQAPDMISFTTICLGRFLFTKGDNDAYAASVNCSFQIGAQL